MAKPITNSSAQKNSFTDYLPPVKELAIRTATYGATSLLLGRVNPVALTISTLNAITVSFAEQFAQAEETGLKKMIVALASLAASTFVVTQVASAIVGQASLAFTQDFALQLAFFNALGETVLFSIPYIANWDTPKLPESVKDLDKLSKKNLLHMRNHFGDFKAMIPEVFNAFVDKLAALEKENLVPKQPKTLEDIKNLDAFEVRYFYEQLKTKSLASIMDLDKEKEWETLFSRFIEQGYPLPIDTFDGYPKQTLLYIRDSFQDFRSMNSDNFVSNLEEYTIPLPNPPKTIEEIQQLDAFGVRYSHTFPEKMNAEILKLEAQEPCWAALHTRFYEEDLPLPNGDTIQKIKEDQEKIKFITLNKRDFYLINIDPLPTLDEVQAFSINRLSWLYCQIHRKFELFKTYSINDQIALNALFYEKFETTFHCSPTMADIADLSDESAKKLHDYYEKSKDSRFLCLPMEVKKALNERFRQLREPLTALSTTYSLPSLDELEKENLFLLHDYFKNNLEEWQKVDEERKIAFNKLFRETQETIKSVDLGLTEFPLTH